MVRQRLAYFGVMLLLCGAVWYDNTRGEKAQANKIQETAIAACVKLNESNRTLKDYILDQIARSEKSLPTVEYYKEHPDELEDALKNIKRQRADTINAFSPVPC